MNTTTANAVSEFQPVTSLDAPRHLNLLIYGVSGIGKTVCGATGPPPVLYIDLDDGLASIRSIRPELAQELGIDTKQIYTQRVRNYAELKKVLHKLHALRASPVFPKTVVFDNLSVAQAICMQERVAGDESQSIDRLPERQDWGILLQRMRAIVRFIRDLPCTSCFIALEQDKEGYVGPHLQGAMFKELPAMLDICARYSLMVKSADDGKGGQIEKEIRYLQCHPSASVPGRSLAVIAKNRGGRLDKIERPHLQHLIDKVFPLATPQETAAPGQSK